MLSSQNGLLIFKTPTKTTTKMNRILSFFMITVFLRLNLFFADKVRERSEKMQIFCVPKAFHFFWGERSV